MENPYYLDLLSEVIAKAPKTSSYSSSSCNVDELELLRALLMNPPEDIVRDGFLEELEYVASHVWNVLSSLDSSKYSEVFLIHTELGQQINSALRPMRMWSDFYALLPDKISIKEKDIVFDDVLTRARVELPIIRAYVKDNRKMFFKEFVILYKKMRSIIDSYGPELLNDEEVRKRCNNHVCTTLRSEFEELKSKFDGLKKLAETKFSALELGLQFLKTITKNKLPTTSSSSGNVSAPYLDLFSELIFIEASRTSSDSRNMKSKLLQLFVSELVAKAPTTSSGSSLYNINKLKLIGALLMNPPEEIVRDGFLEELESVASHVRDIYYSFDGSKHVEVFQTHTTMGQQITSALRPMRIWSDFYWLPPDTKSVQDRDAPYHEVLTRLGKAFEITIADIKGHRKMFFKDFVWLYRKIKVIIDSYSSQDIPYDEFDSLCENEIFVTLETVVKQLKPSENDFPRTGHLGFEEHLMQNLKELVEAKADSLGPLTSYILELLDMLQELLQLLNSRPTGDEYVQSQITTLARRSFEVEIAVDSFLVGSIPAWLSMIRLRHILGELKTDVQQFKMVLGDPQSLASRIKAQGRDNFKMYPVLINNNTNVSEKLQEVIRDPVIQDQYKVCTWCLASSYTERKKEVFIQLLRNASGRRHLLEHVKERYPSYISIKELKRWVHKILEKEDYLIILDDVHDGDALFDILEALPTDSINRRRAILFTTPSVELAAVFRDGHPVFDHRRKSKEDSSTSQTNEPASSSDVVGFEVETKSMLDQLTGEPKKLNIVSIVGMGGQGKTTLAKKLYDDPLIVNHFSVRAWCSVSQVYKKRELFMKLLNQVGKLSHSIPDNNDAELAHMLWKSLTGQRFLIVLDDIWSIDVWYELQRCFPNDNNGSRIIFTTRQQDLASQAKSSSMLQHLGLLSIGESLELLRKKVSWPPKLSDIARQIAERCKGLPISIVLIAGLLKKIEKEEDQWKKIAQSLFEEGKELGQPVIELSYKYLPNHLKSCFLYLGVFLEDKEIRVSKLIRLWVAEGFIRHEGLKSLEDIAETCLMDLISRSLVTIAQKIPSSGIKSCLIHDLIRDFCLTKARKENFLELIQGYDKHLLSSTNDVDYGINSNYSCSSKPTRYSVCRLSIHSKINHFIKLNPFGPFVRSLLFFPADNMRPAHPYDISFISKKFKLLRVLDLEDNNIGNSLKAIEALVLLRYLAVQGYVDFVPSSIANLWNLETFLVRGLSAKFVKISNSILDMKKLRHAHINDVALFDWDPHKLENSSELGNLQSFSRPALSYGDDMGKIMRKIMPGIQKLKCIFLDSWDDIEKFNQFPDLEFLIKLVSLKVLYNGTGKYPCKFSLPSNLKRLSLSKFHLSWNEISQLSNLPELEVLKLRDISFEDETWEMNDDVVFQKLKFLKLDIVNIVKWDVSNENFPYLEHLLLHKCDQLKMIPESVGDIDTLETIEVMWCNPFVATSAKSIQADQLEYGKELMVHILPNL